MKEFKDYYKHLQEQSEKASRELREKARARLKPMRDACRKYDDKAVAVMLEIWQSEINQEGKN